jgi:hypothetical protein
MRLLRLRRNRLLIWDLGLRSVSIFEHITKSIG